MKVKICGISRKEDALYLAKSNADFIGFVFAESKRKVSPDLAKSLTSLIGNNIYKVGVFVNEIPQRINEIASFVGLDFVQLHGDETADEIKQIEKPVIKAFSIDQAEKVDLKQFNCQYFLIDSPPEKYRGGSGKVFNWHRLETLNIDPNKLIVAGGLSAENVKTLKKQINPYAVDVSSGVETDGVKDQQKIEHFLKEAKM